MRFMEPVWGRSGVGKKFRSLNLKEITRETKCKWGGAIKMNFREIWHKVEN
jgi:hypothetical protein